jgi:hypothetical protein
MSIDKLTKLRGDTQKLIDSYDTKGLYGAIPFLEEVIENLDLAIEELELEEQDWVGEEE